MNKKQKIIVSIVGITIVMLALLGITYAYYLTRIEGNTNTNSISITTADLKLVYSENSPEIITENNIMPGTTIGEKTFTVSNTGNSAVEDYKVVLEYAVLEGIVPSVFVRPQDFEITMTCVSKNIETNEVSGTCSGYTGTWNNESFEMTTNDIAENIKHEYTLTIFYANPDIDQSDDMGKNLNLKVQIYGANETSTITGTIDNVDETYAIKLNSNPKISTIKKITDSEGNIKYQYKFIGVEPNTGDDSHTLTLVNKSNVEQTTGNITIKKGTNANIDGSTITVKDNQTNIFLTTSNGSTLTNSATFNPYSDNTNTLAYHIINNSINNENGTKFLEVPETNPAEEISYTKVTGKKEMELDMSSQSEWFVGSTAEEAQPWNNGYEYYTSVSGCVDELVNNYISYYESNDSWYVKSCKSLTVAIVEGEVIEYESSLLTTQDNYGTSYYFRGAVEDNYVTFNNMCWRIVRINGDGSIKLTLESQSPCREDMTSNFSIGTANWGYKAVNDTIIGNYKNSTSGMKNLLNTWFDTNFKSEGNLTNAGLKVKDEEWCLGNVTNTYSDNRPYGLLGTTALENYSLGTIFHYETGRNLGGLGVIPNATLKCNGEKDISQIGALTADEVVFAGGTVKSGNDNYYLDDNNWWTISRAYFDGTNDTAFLVFHDASVIEIRVYNSNYYVRPAVSLKAGSVISEGDGTLNNPYIIAD